MTIQASVVLWTVLCFLLLAVILDRLLFRPVLALLDRRRERVESARRKREEYERMEAEYARRREQARAAAAEQRKKQVNDDIERVRAEGKSRLEAANEDRLRRVERYRVQTEADCAELLAALSRQAEDLAVSFAESLTR